MSKEKKNIITLTSEDGDINVEVVDQTVIDGTTYLLVADVTDDDEDSDCYILKEILNNDSDFVDYEVVSDEEADSVFDVFSGMLSDSIELKK
ncbi:MAG: DUF1292 domain-containing protein [Lachnospiraceae bacterium]|nr:DUF1292 domain-containing protein [Lachnospiraceae bacterium]